MKESDEALFNISYQKLLQALTLQGKADKTIEAYSRTLCRVLAYFDRLPETLSPDDLKDYFAALVVSHSWSTVKIDRPITGQSSHPVFRGGKPMSTT